MQIPILRPRLRFTSVRAEPISTGYRAPAREFRKQNAFLCKEQMFENVLTNKNICSILFKKQRMYFVAFAVYKGGTQYEQNIDAADIGILL